MVFRTTHSIYLDDYNTLEDFHLLPTARPYVAPPKPKTDFTEVTGMNGVLDYTNALVDGPLYEDREGSWKFKFLYFGNYTWHDLYYDLYTKIHGSWFNHIVLEDDEEHFYRGRVTVESWNESDDGLEISLKYRVEPRRYSKGEEPDAEDERPTAKTTEYESWKWDDLLSVNSIYYGKFTVVDSKRRTLINPTSRTVSVNAFCTSPFTAQKEDDSEIITLPYGPNTNAFTIEKGNTVIDFYGTGDIQLSYPME